MTHSAGQPSSPCLSLGPPLAAAVLGLSVGATAHADSIPPPPAPITLPEGSTVKAPFTTQGVWLEGNLGRMVTQCNRNTPLVATWDNWGKHSQQVSAVPPELRTAVTLTKVIRPFDEGDVTRLFGAVWDKSDLASATHGPNDYLPLDYSSDTDQATLPGLDGNQYKETCSNIMSAAMGVNGQYSLPFASVQAGLQSAYNGSVTSGVDLATGTFSSPFWAAYSGNLPNASDQQQRLAAEMLFWEWYEADQSRIGKTGYIVTSFVGDALYRHYGASTTFSTQVKFSGSLNALGFASATANASGNFQSSTGLSGQSYQVAIEQSGAGGVSAQMQPVPSVDDVITAAGRDAKFSLLQSDNAPILQANSERIITQQIEAFPRAYCANVWSSTVPLVNIEPVATGTAAEMQTSRLTACKFTFKYLSTADDKGMPVKVTPIVSRFVTDGQGARHTLQLTAQTVIIPTSNMKVSKQAVVPKPVASDAGGGNTTLSWKTQWQILGAPSLTADPITVNSAVLTCPSSIPIYNQPTVDKTPPSGIGNGPKSFTLTWRVEIDGVAVADVDKWTNSATCSLQADISLTTVAGDTIEQTLEQVQLLYPFAPS